MRRLIASFDTRESTSLWPHHVGYQSGTLYTHRHHAERQRAVGPHKAENYIPGRSSERAPRTSRGGGRKLTEGNEVAGRQQRQETGQSIPKPSKHRGSSVRTPLTALKPVCVQHYERPYRGWRMGGRQVWLRQLALWPIWGGIVSSARGGGHVVLRAAGPIRASARTYDDSIGAHRDDRNWRERTNQRGHSGRPMRCCLQKTLGASKLGEMGTQRTYLTDTGTSLRRRTGPQ